MSADSIIESKATKATPIKSYWNLEPSELVEHAIANGEGTLADNGAFVCSTGKFTGRSPENRYIVKDEYTRGIMFWGPGNNSINEETFDKLYKKMQDFINTKPHYIKDAFICAPAKYRMNVRLISSLAWHNLFFSNMFVSPEKKELINFEAEFTVLCIPEFEAIPEEGGTRQENFTILNISRKIVLIGGSAYSGEIKTGLFSMLNIILPHEKNAFTMHCSANIGEREDTALFFGLSGTGKTTLATDPSRRLIGDDEHVWSNDDLFNIENGCYAKVSNLSEEEEPLIWDAIKFGSVVENTKYFIGTRRINFADRSISENARASYPLSYIQDSLPGYNASRSKNIFFLAADGLGILPPISRLTKAQAVYYFISGYTSKITGTEAGLISPALVFSTCFGEPFMPLHPIKYTNLLKDKIDENTNVWLVNTGWIGGTYGVGKRIKLKYTRTLINAALNDLLSNINWRNLPIFNLKTPTDCPGVPSNILYPMNVWSNKDEYMKQLVKLAKAFDQNFNKYRNLADELLISGGPQL